MNPESNSTIEQVFHFAATAHGDQRRKYADELYIEHPRRVMQVVSAYVRELPVLSAALLHDVLEDTAVTAGEINLFLADLMPADQVALTMKMVQELTDVYTKKAYPKWNRRKRKAMEHERLKLISSFSKTIKYADIIDNCDKIVNADPDFARVFLHEYRVLLRYIPGGDENLYQIAVDKVNRKLADMMLN